MITLLMALFIVMWSMAHGEHLEVRGALRCRCKEAFSGKILPGGEAVAAAGLGLARPSRPRPSRPIPTIVPGHRSRARATASARTPPQKEAEDLEKLKAEIDAWSEEHGLAKEVQTVDRQARPGRDAS